MSEAIEQFQKLWATHPIDQEWWYVKGFEAGRISGLEEAAKIAESMQKIYMSNTVPEQVAAAIREKIAKEK